ncbi:MAG: hypothetical protein ACTSXU_12250 [Promethearchaeota archaeon]
MNKVISLTKRTFLIRFSFLNNVSLKNPNIHDFLDFASFIKIKYNINVIFLRLERLLPMKVMTAGIYHAIKNYHERNIHLSKIFAFNVIMHLFCTSQIEFIQKNIIPENMQSSRLQDILAIFIKERKEGTVFSNEIKKIMNLLVTKEYLEENDMITRLENDGKRFYAMNVFKNTGKKINEKENESFHYNFNSKAISSIARFSLEKQLKSHYQ